MRHIDTTERRARLGRRQHLAASATGVEAVAGTLVGLHSSDAATVYLSARARIDGFAVADLDAALYERRSLLRLLGMRRTMFVVPHDVGATMTISCTEAFVAGERKRLIGWLESQNIATEGDAWLADVEARVIAALVARGEATAQELKEDVPELGARIAFGEGKKWAGTVGVSTRVLFLLATKGEIVRARPRGSWVSSQYRWTATSTWIPEGLPSTTRDEAEQDLLRRWLRTYGPGTETDLVWWTGWGKRRTRSVLAALGAVEVTLDDDTGYVLPDDVDAVPEPPRWAALLPSLDSTVMGWKDRGWYLGPHAEALYDRNGNAGPTVWVDGRIVGGWAQHQDGDVVFELLERVDAEAAGLIAADAERLTAWLGDTRVRARFPTPLERRLIAEGPGA